MLQLYTCNFDNPAKIRLIPHDYIKKCEIKTTIGEPNQLSIEFSYLGGDIANYYANYPNSAIRVVANGFDGYFVKDEESQINGLTSTEITFLSSWVKTKKNRPSFAINNVYTGSLYAFIRALSDNHYFTFLSPDQDISTNTGALDNYKLLDNTLKKVSWTYFEAGVKTVNGIPKPEIIIGDFLSTTESIKISNFFVYNNDYQLINFKKKQTNTIIKYLEPIAEKGQGTSLTNAIFLNYSVLQDPNYPLGTYNGRLYIQNLKATNISFKTKVFSSSNTLNAQDLYGLGVAELKKLDNTLQYEATLASKKFIRAGQKAELNIGIKGLIVLNNQSAIIKESKYNFLSGKGEIVFVFESTVSHHGRIQKVLIDLTREFNNNQYLPKS